MESDSRQTDLDEESAQAVDEVMYGIKFTGDRATQVERFRCRYDLSKSDVLRLFTGIALGDGDDLRLDLRRADSTLRSNGTDLESLQTSLDQVATQLGALDDLEAVGDVDEFKTMLQRIEQVVDAIALEIGVGVASETEAVGSGAGQSGSLTKEGSSAQSHDADDKEGDTTEWT